MSGDPMEGRRHCDQCFRFFQKTDEHYSVFRLNWMVNKGIVVNAETIFCSLNCMELWKRDVGASIAHQGKEKQ